MTTILDVETLEWYSVKQSLPDADTTVLVYVPADGGDPVTLGFYDGADWFSSDVANQTPLAVTAWADMPKGPQRLWP